MMRQEVPEVRVSPILLLSLFIVWRIDFEPLQTLVYIHVRRSPNLLTACNDAGQLGNRDGAYWHYGRDNCLASLHFEQKWDAIPHPCLNFNGGLAKPPLKLGHGWAITSQTK